MDRTQEYNEYLSQLEELSKIYNNTFELTIEDLHYYWYKYKHEKNTNISTGWDLTDYNTYFDFDDEIIILLVYSIISNETIPTNLIYHKLFILSKKKKGKIRGIRVISC